MVRLDKLADFIRYVKLIEDGKAPTTPFLPVEEEDLADIKLVGNPFPAPPGHMDFEKFPAAFNDQFGTRIESENASKY